MKSNYKFLGDYIRRVVEKNTDLSVNTLLGVSMTKTFIPSVANTIGVDMANYQIVRRNQFACKLMSVGRDEQLPVDLLKDYDAVLVSSAYYVFESLDENILLSEYLMMWFCRKETDRWVGYISGGDVRGGISWDTFCEMQIIVPSIEKQREIVMEYNTIVSHIKLNEQLNQKLEETTQSLYKHWFIDFEFPSENGKPYKSSGGIMVYDEGLDQEIPEGWEIKSFTEAINLKGGGTPSTLESSYWDGDIPFFTPKDVDITYYSLNTGKYMTQSGLNSCSSKLYPKNTVFVTARGTVGAVSIAGVPMAMNQSCYAILGDKNISQFYAHQLTLETIKSLKEEAIGAVFNALVTKDFEGKKVIIPSKEILEKFDFKISPIYENLCNKSKQNIALQKLSELTLQRISKVETLQTEQAV